LSSFGTQKGYPIIVRCANLPSEIRNGKGIGGGAIVGWLPIVCNDYSSVLSILTPFIQVDETEENKGKLDSITFKRIVWHQSFQRLLESIKLHSQTGCLVVCGDGIERLLFPFIPILSADYEEQYVISIL